MKAVFEIKNYKDYLQILLEQYSEFNSGNNITSSRHAILCAMLAYHMREWLLKSNTDGVKTYLLKLGFIDQFFLTNDENIKCKFNEYTNKRCPELKLIRDICDGAKHFKLSRKNIKIAESSQRDGAFDCRFFDARHFETNDLIIVDLQGKEIIFKDILAVVIQFWKKLIEEISEVENSGDTILNKVKYNKTNL